MSNENNESKKVNKDIKETNKKVISLSEAVENTKENEKPKDEVKREKIKLDELVKKTNETEKSEEKSKDVIVNFSEEKNKAKANVSKNKTKEEKEKKEQAKVIKKNIKLVGGAKTEEQQLQEEIKNKKNIKEENDIKEEINLDVLGVKRAEEPNIIFDKIKEVLITILLILVGLTILILLPIFNVNEVNITGINLLSKEEVLEQIKYDKSKNFFFLFMIKPEEKLMELPQINNVATQFAFPNVLNIRIEEINVAGYIPYLSDEYIYIDSYGKIVEISKEKLEGIPLIEGLNFKSFKLGNILDTSNKESLNIIIEITNVLNKYDLANRIDSIDVTSSDDLKLYIGNIEVDLGEIEDVDQKIRIAIEAINNLSKNAKGILNVSSSSGKVYFRPIA